MVSIREQFIIFTCCVLAGFASGFVYDLCRTLKSELRLKRAAASVDLIFWSVVLYIFFITLFKSGNGQMRGFALIGFALGFAVYFFAISKEVSGLLKIIIRFLIRLIYYVVYPFKKIYAVLGRVLSRFVRIVQNIQKKAEKIVRKRLEKTR